VSALQNPVCGSEVQRCYSIIELGLREKCGKRVIAPRWRFFPCHVGARRGVPRSYPLNIGYQERHTTKHEIILYWSDDDQSFIAEVPELAGCAADGSTRQEALANVEVVIGEWIETAKELGRPIPEPKGRLSFA
jgi:predicted RNase H-like HicB family nuclease